MSIRTKIALCFICILFSLALTTILNYFRAKRSNDQLILINTLLFPLSRVVVQLQSNINGYAENARRYLFSFEKNMEHGSFSRMVKDLYPYIVNKKFQTINSLLHNSSFSEVRPIIARLEQVYEDTRKGFEGLLISSNKENFENNYASLKEKINFLNSYLDEEWQKITLKAQKESADFLFINLCLSTLVVILGIFTFWMSQRILKPLPKLICSIKKIANGEFNQSLKVDKSAKDEVAILAREYNKMLEALKERENKIEIQQKELLQSEKLVAIGQLSAEIVHEIRNPLNSISLNIDWLKSELGSSSNEIHRTLNSISKEVERLNLITESYLVKARMPLKRSQNTSIHEVLNEILDFSNEELAKEGIKIEKKFSGKDFKINVDKSALKQAFYNIIRNAKEAMPEGGTLQINTNFKTPFFEIDISDTGYGMSENVKQKIFEPFFTTKNDGTGLGMSVTKKIIEECCGDIKCESSIGRGTTMKLRFQV